jgi:hypothetical protein
MGANIFDFYRLRLQLSTFEFSFSFLFFDDHSMTMRGSFKRAEAASVSLP